MFSSHYCSGRAVSVTYSECVFVASGIQHAKAHVPYYDLWSVWLYRIFHIIP